MKYRAKLDQEIPTCNTWNSSLLIADRVNERPGRAQVMRPTVVLLFFQLSSFLSRGQMK